MRIDRLLAELDPELREIIEDGLAGCAIMVILIFFGAVVASMLVR